MNVNLIELINLHIVEIIVGLFGIIVLLIGIVMYIKDCDGFYSVMIFSMLFIFLAVPLDKTVLIRISDNRIQLGYEVCINGLLVDANKIDIYSYDNFKIDDNNKRIIISVN